MLTGTTYDVQVRAVNSNGFGPWSNSGTGTTHTAPTAPNAPTIVVDGTTLIVSWTAPTTSLIITHYNLRYRFNQQAWFGYSDISGTTQRVINLQIETEYEVQVQAVSNTISSAWSDSATATTGGLPGQPNPPGVSATDGSVTQLDITWTTPSEDGGSGITRYDLRHSRQGLDSWVLITNRGGNSYTLSGLLTGTTYDVQVRAVNSNGFGPWSNSGTGTTHTAPTAPNAPTIVVDGTTLIVSWTAPTTSLIITHYNLRYRFNQQAWFGYSDISGTTQRVINLQIETEYEVQVQAVSNTISSAWSDSATATTGGLPGQPNPPGVSATDGSVTQLDITWTTPSEDGGSGITRYDLRHSRQGLDSWVLITNRGGNSYTLSGLLTGTTYDVQVRAVNSNGFGPWSNSGTGTTRNSLSSITNIVLRAGSGSIQVSWVKNNYADTIEVTQIGWQQTGSLSWSDSQQAISTESFYTITGLSANTSYNIRLRVYNTDLSMGVIDWSDSISETTQNPVLSNIHIAEQDSALLITWIAGGYSSEYSTIVSWRVSSDNVWSAAQEIITSNNFVLLTNLDNGVRYDVRLKIRNTVTNTDYGTWTETEYAIPFSLVQIKGQNLYITSFSVQNVYPENTKDSDWTYFGCQQFTDCLNDVNADTVVSPQRNYVGEAHRLVFTWVPITGNTIGKSAIQILEFVAPTTNNFRLHIIDAGLSAEYNSTTTLAESSIQNVLVPTRTSIESSYQVEIDYNFTEDELDLNSGEVIFTSWVVVRFEVTEEQVSPIYGLAETRLTVDCTHANLSVCQHEALMLQRLPLNFPEEDVLRQPGVLTEQVLGIVPIPEIPDARHASTTSLARSILRPLTELEPEQIGGISLNWVLVPMAFISTFCAMLITYNTTKSQVLTIIVTCVVMVLSALLFLGITQFIAALVFFLVIAVAALLIRGNA